MEITKITEEFGLATIIILIRLYFQIYIPIFNRLSFFISYQLNPSSLYSSQNYILISIKQQLIYKMGNTS